MRRTLTLLRLPTLLALAVLAWAGISPALAASYTDHSDGTVTDTATGLMWDKCSWGQTNNVDCSGGSAGTYTWQQALALAVTANAGNYKGHSDWRLPNVKELESIVKIDAANPAIDTTAFPNTIAAWYWSSTPYTPYPANAWVVSFDYGSTVANGQTVGFHVRLVRSGQSFAPFDALATYALTVAKTGTGSGTVSSSPAGIDCGATCTANFDASASVTLTGAAATGSSFTGWSGAGCSGTSTCVVTMDAAQNVTADFALNTYAVTAGAGAGGTASCTPNPATHGGSSTCTATPDANYTFSAWTGDCAGQGASCTLNSITSAKSSVASFAAVVVAPTISGTPGNGTVGTAYSFTPTATGSPTFAATGLPPGLNINAATGVVSGTPTTAGSYNVTITATNAGGTATLNATIAIAPAAAPVGSTSVPTLSEWGMILLSLLLAGVAGMRRR